MAAIYQVVWEWSGTGGGAGFTNLFYDATVDTPTDALAACTKSRLLFDGVKTCLPDPVSLRLHTDVRVLSDTDGSLLNIYTVTGIANVTGSGGSLFSAPSGAGIDWLTTTVHGTRRMQGRTFLVPCASGVYDSSGNIESGRLTTIATAAEAMRTASGPAFGVWGRPKYAVPATTPPTIVRPGLWGPATSSRVPDRSFVLTSRRD
jgi:hypothetical protein